MKLTKIDEMFLRLKGAKIYEAEYIYEYDSNSCVYYKNMDFIIEDNDNITLRTETGFAIKRDFSNVEEIIKSIKEYSKKFNDVKNELLNLLNTPIEEKKKYIYEHLEELEE